jgi:hypothetical protein
VDAGSILGLQPLRPSFLDDVSAAEPRQTEADNGDRVVTTVDNCATNYVLDDDEDDIDDEDDDDVDEDDDEDEDDEDEEEEETWQVSQSGRFL